MPEGIGYPRKPGRGCCLLSDGNEPPCCILGIGVTPVHRKFRYLGDSFGRDAVFYRRNPQLPGNNEYWTNEATLRPSFARMWRRDRFSFWLGAEFEHDRWRHKRSRKV